MKFFLPHAESQEQTDQVYASIRSFLCEELRAIFDDRKIFRLLYRHEGKRAAAEVGKFHPLNDEPIIAILYEPGKNRYHVCTPTRGVIKGKSILVGGHSVEAVIEFDE
jgi:hypothetical protein